MSESTAVQSLNSVQLNDVVLVSVLARSRQEEQPIPPDAEVKWRLDTRISYRQPSPNELNIKVDAELAYLPDSPQPFDLAIGMVGKYRSANPITEEQVPAVLSTHSLPLLWPYLRELISSLTLRMGGPVIVIPTLIVQIDIAGSPKTRRRKPQTEKPGRESPQ